MNARGPFVLVLLAASLTGCATPAGVTLIPIENQIPPLRPGVRDIRMLDVPPVLASDIRPFYPPELFNSGVNGTAIVLFTVRADGVVTDASVIKTNDIHFRNAAIEAVLRWRFSPARVDGVPVACRMTTRCVFSSPLGKINPRPSAIGFNPPIPFEAEFPSGGHR